MSIIRSERSAAGLLLGAAVLGLVLANTALGPALFDLEATVVAVPGTGIRLSLGHWVSDGLLAVFFFIVAVDLRHELVAGELNSVRTAIRPGIAALGGIVVPALVYLAIAAPAGYAGGWPIPTATDIAFALGVLALFGRGLPNRVRVFLLALAVLDDLVAILVIAVFFAHDVDLGMLALGAVAVLAFALAGRALRGRMRAPVGVLMVLLALLAWALVLLSGVHATIAGVALGLAMPRVPARRVVHGLEPWSNGLVLPLFAFSAALVAIPQVPPSRLAAPFWAILVALPAGKFAGIALGGWLGSFAVAREDRRRLGPSGLAVVATLGGIGFTVSLLMNELAFARRPEVADEGTLAVLLGSGIAMAASAVVVTAVARRHRRRHPPPAPRPAP